MVIEQRTAAAMLDALPYSAALIDRDTTILAVNPAWRAFGARNGGTGNDVGTEYRSVCLDAASTALDQALAGIPAETRYPCHAPGRPRWFDLVARPVGDGTVLVMHVEVTEQVRLRRRLDALEAAFLDINTGGSALEVSRRWSELTGQRREHATGLGWLDVFRRDDRGHILQVLLAGPTADAAAHEHTVAMPGSGRWLEIRAVPDMDGDEWIGWQVTAADCTDEVSVRRQAERDPLTGLLNRRAFEERMASRLADDRRSTGLLFVDLDGFKQVNDELGHTIGDEVLVVVAHRLRADVRAMDLVGRYGGDEFVIGIDGLDEDGLAAKAARVDATLAEPMHLEDDITLRIGASVGWTTAKTGDTVTDLFQRADGSMYETKRLRRAIQADHD